MADLTNFQSSTFLPPTWKEIKRLSGKENQVVIRLGHFNPELKMDKINSQPNVMLKHVDRGNVYESTSTVGITTAKGNNMTAFYENMIEMAKMGLLKTFTVAQIEDLRAKRNVDTPEDCDFWTDLTVVKYGSEPDAAQALANISGMMEKGLVDTVIPGSNGMTFKDVMKNPTVRAAAKERGVGDAQLDDLVAKMEEASAQQKEAVKKVDVRYENGTFLGKPAVFMIPPKIVKPKPQPRTTGIVPKKTTMPDGSVIEVGGGGGFDDRVKLPSNWQNKEEFPIDGHVLQAIQVGPYVISGSHLGAYNYMPTGKSFTQSLTKFKTETDTTKEGDKTFIGHYIVPEYSTMASEGYFHREEIEEMIKKLISALEA